MSQPVDPQRGAGNTEFDPEAEFAQRAALAAVAFGSASELGQRSQSRHLAFLPPEELQLDLEDPVQRRLGDYELLEKLGQGGMGVVYRARQLSLNREVALKLLASGPWSSPDFIQRFRAEAQFAARMQHPNIVAIHEIGAHEDLNYFAMRLVHGPTLAAVLARHGPFEPRAAARILRPVAEALDYAHRLGVLHLDLKPANILVDEHGEPQVADFGLARGLDQSMSVDSDEVSGTPSYMAPEQAQLKSHKLSPATDIYGLGAILYELLCGVPPIQGPTAQETLKRVVGQEPERPRSRRRSIPADLEAVCLKCLAKDPGERYASARELADELTRFVEGRPVRVRPLGPAQRAARWARREPRFAVAIALVAVSLLAGLAVSATQWRRAEGNAALALENAARTRATLWSQRRGAAQQAFLANKGFEALPGLLANLREQERHGARGDAAIERLRIGLLLDSSPRLIDVFATGKALLSVALHPDGGLVAAGAVDGTVSLYEAGTGRRLWEVDISAEPRFFAGWAEAYHLAFSPDGRYLLASNAWPLAVVVPSGKDMYRIEVASGTLTRPGERFPDFVDATFSPDGVHAILRDRYHHAQLWDAEAWRPLGPKFEFDHIGPGWLLPTGAAWFATWNDGPGTVRIRDAETLRVLREIPASGAGPGREVRSWSASASGRWMAVGREDGEVLVVDTATDTLALPGPRPSNVVFWLEFGADEKTLVAGSWDGSAHVWNWPQANLRGRVVRHDQLVRSARYAPGAGVLGVSLEGPAALWQLAGDGELGALPVPLSPAMVHPGQMDRYAVALDGHSGLVATAGKEGEIRSWRLARSPLMPATAAPQAGAELHFDGKHLVAVDGTRASVQGIAAPHASSAAMEHPQPVGVALLTADGKTLLTSSGRELRAWDWRSAKLRVPPIVLENSPLRVALSPGGVEAIASYGDYRDGRFVEVAQCFDLRNGAPCAAAVAIPGPLTGMRYSPDGSRVLHWRANELVLRDARSLAPAAETPGLLPEGDAVTDARLSPDGKVLYAGIQSDRMASHVLRVELRAPGSPTRFPQGAIPIAVMPLHGDSGVAVQLYESKGVSQLLPDGQELALPYDRKLRYVRAMAASADGSMLAMGLRDGVILTDAASAQALAPPLRFAFSAPDAVQQLAFSPDGESIAARTVFGRWLVWNLRRDARSADTIAAEAALLHPGAEQRRQLPAAALAPELRAELRKRDPGPPEPATAPPPTSCVAAVPTGFPRSPAASSELLDLQPHYNQSPREHTPDLSFGFTRLCALPLGVQRFLGVDYDVRGTIALAFDAPVRAGAPRLRKVEGIALPHPRFVALNVLATSAASLSDPSLRPAILNVVLRYRDGSVERLPLRWRMEVQRSGDFEPGPRIAWFGETTGTEVSEYHWREGSFAARLENPHPERDALALDLEATDVTWSAPVVLAISLETTESRAAAGAGPSRP